MTVMVASLHMRADLFAIRELGPWLRSSLASVVGEVRVDEVIGTIELALHELCINIVEHAYRGTDGSILLSMNRSTEGCSFVVVDEGQPFLRDLSTSRDPNEHTVRGYGLAIVKQLASSLDYERTGPTNRWRVNFFFSSASPTADQHLASSEVTTPSSEPNQEQPS